MSVGFLVVAFFSYKFGQFPASQVAYAYFLVSFTMICVATYGVAAKACEIVSDAEAEQHRSPRPGEQPSPRLLLADTGNLPRLEGSRQRQLVCARNHP
jgi:hypothetical protein